MDRATVEFLLGVRRWRAQQIMAPCITDHLGTNGLADRNALIDRLRRLAGGDDGFHEDFDKLPPGVCIDASRIAIEFDQPQQALERLLALAMAISNDYDRFERRAGHA